MLNLFYVSSNDFNLEDCLSYSKPQADFNLIHRYRLNWLDEGRLPLCISKLPPTKIGCIYPKIVPKLYINSSEVCQKRTYSR